MGNDIKKPLKKLGRSIAKRGITIGVGIGGGGGGHRNNPAGINPQPTISVNVNATNKTVTPAVNMPRVARAASVALNRPRRATASAPQKMPPTFPMYRWSLDAHHHILSFDNVNPPGAGWRLNPSTPVGRVYKEAAYGKMIAIHRWKCASDANSFFYGPNEADEETELKRQRTVGGYLTVDALNVMYAVRRGGIRVNVHATGHCLGTIRMLRP